MKKYAWMTVLTALILGLLCVNSAFAEIIPPLEPGQQIGYPAVVLCEKLTLREEPSASSKSIGSLKYGSMPIVINADQPSGAEVENGFVYCTLGDSEDSLTGWINADYIVINPFFYVTEKKISVYAWNSTGAPKVAQLSAGTRLPILKEEGNWYIVSLRGAVGWVRK